MALLLGGQVAPQPGWDRILQHLRMEVAIAWRHTYLGSILGAVTGTNSSEC